jgi:hypothetical protein
MDRISPAVAKAMEEQADIQETGFVGSLALSQVEGCFRD